MTGILWAILPSDNCGTKYSLTHCVHVKLYTSVNLCTYAHTHTHTCNDRRTMPNAKWDKQN